jgi:ribosomal protein S27E
MKINCISCGHNLVVDDAYDDFEGLFKCYICGGLLKLKTADGKIKSVSPVESRSGTIQPGLEMKSGEPISG